MSKKEELLQAMRGVLKQYADKTHENMVASCPLCIAYSNENTCCGNCPMTIFKGGLGCMNRKCRPMNIDKDVVLNGELYRRYRAVMEFYEEAIKTFESLDEKDINRTSLKLLIKIDKRIAKKHGIYETKQ